MAKDFKPRMKPAMKKPAGKKPNHKKNAGKKIAVRPGRGERPSEQPRETMPQRPKFDSSPVQTDRPANGIISRLAATINLLGNLARIRDWAAPIWEWLAPLLEAVTQWWNGQ